MLDGAGGNPFLAVEMLTGLRSADAPGETVPPGLVVGVPGRLKSLRPGTLRFLRMGAVLGRRFGFADAAALCGQPSAELIAALDEVVRTGLLDDDGDHLCSRHDLLRQAVYVDIPPSARKALHREAANRLVSAGTRSTSAASSPASGSSAGSSRSRPSRTVTAQPKRAKTWASSTPMTPPPRTSRDAGSSLDAMASRLVQYGVVPSPGTEAIR